MQNNILGKEKILNLFIKFTVPAIIAMLINGMQTIIDGIFLGNFVGPNAMASVNLVQPFNQVIVGSATIMSTGALSFIGRSLGEGEIKKSQNIFKTSLLVLISVSLFISIMGVSFSDKIALALGSNDVLLESVSTYIKTISIFATPIALMFLCGFVDRVIERPDLYLKGSVLSLFTNICLNYVLIKVLQLGIKGAAIATGVSFTVAFLVVSTPFFNKKSTLNIFKGKFDKSTILPVIYNGSSEGAISLSIATNAYIFNMVFMKIAGENGIAAFTSISYIAQVTTLLMFGISDGIGPIISYNYGYKKFDRVNKTLEISYKFILGIGITLFLVLFFNGGDLVKLFAGSNKEVLDLAVSGSKLYAFAFLMSGFNIVYSGYFTFIGYAKESVLIALFRGTIFVVVGIMIFPQLMGIPGVWLTVPFAELMTIILGTLMMRKNQTEIINTVAA